MCSHPSLPPLPPPRPNLAPTLAQRACLHLPDLIINYSYLFPSWYADSGGLPGWLPGGWDGNLEAPCGGGWDGNLEAPCGGGWTCWQRDKQPGFIGVLVHLKCHWYESLICLGLCSSYLLLHNNKPPKLSVLKQQPFCLLMILWVSS